MTSGTVKRMIVAACDAWTEASWTHELEHDGTVVRDDHGHPVYCDGNHDGCDYCAAVRVDAARAAEFGREALQALDEGDFDAAYELVLRAMAIERVYGDAPTWRPVVRAIERML